MQKPTNDKKIKAAGLMSGTSLDGIDVAFIESDGIQVSRFGKSFHLSYDEKQRNRLKEALKEAKEEKRPTRTNKFINDIEEELTRLHVDAVKKAMSLNGLNENELDVIGFHGQTLLHGPNEGWSWQIGNGSVLSQELNTKVVNDFRRYDVENGGQGAPFVPVYHHAIMQGKQTDFPIALLNIGGVANLTWIGNENNEDLVAFDTGPGNALLDDFVRLKTNMKCDQDGMISSKGVVDEELVKKWMSHHYFDQKAPKSLDRDDFNVEEVNDMSLEDGAATLCAFTVKAIQKADSLCPEQVKNWYVCGGGAHNPTIMAMLTAELSGNVKTIDNLGFDGDFIEAEAFAFLAIRRLYNLPITFPGTTGIDKPSSGGVIHLP